MLRGNAVTRPALNGWVCKCARTPLRCVELHRKRTLQGWSQTSRKKALPGHERLQNRDTATKRRQLWVSAIYHTVPDYSLFCTVREALARVSARCAAARLAASLAANESAQLAQHYTTFSRILTYRIATLQTHCKSLALKNQAGWCCRQVPPVEDPIRKTLRSGSRTGTRKRKKSPCCL